MAEYFECEKLYDFLTEQLEPETGMYSKGRNNGINIARSALHNRQIMPAADVAPVVWKPVVGYEGLYEVSSLGQVRNKTGVVLRPGFKKARSTFYKTVSLYKNGKGKSKTIHRLVAEAFIENPTALPFVNHKDEDGTNNCVENLEWCTREYNVNYGTAKARRTKKIKGVPHTEEHNEKISGSLKEYYRNHNAWNKGKAAKENDTRLTAVRCVDSEGNAKTFVSIAEAVRETGARQQNISLCIAGKRKSTAGYVWERVETNGGCKNA